MKLYGHPISANTRKVLILLAEKGHAAEFVVVDLMAKEHKQEAHLARQPFGHIPVLEDDGFSLFESNAILRYLDQKLPTPTLTPKELHDRGRMEQWFSVEQAELYPAMRKIHAREYARMMKLEDPGPAVVEQGKSETSHLLDVLTKALGSSDYLAGDRFSLVDLCWLPGLNMLFDAKLGQMVTERPNLAGWWQRVSSRPSWRKLLSDLSNEASS